MPKIAIDISPLNNGNSVRGVGYYTKNLVAALQREVSTNPGFKNFQIDLIENSTNLQSKSYDLIHYPYFDPFFLTLPFKSNIPTIISMHDLIPLELKNMYPVGIKGWLKWQFQRYKARQANYIITISHYSKYIISDLLHYPVDKIYVTYLAADNSFKKIKDSKKLSSIKKKYNLPSKFVLYLGDINRNKNIPTLVESCLKLKYPLVIVGSSATEKVDDHPWTKDLIWLQSQAQEHESTSELLLLLGYVPNDDLPSIFNLATIYCQPSYSEGFGLPLVQAMQSGLPVVYSQASSLPEVMDYNGESFDPYQSDDLTRALKKLWTNPKLLSQYSKSGLARAKIFSWRNVALQTLAVYQLALLNEK